MKFISSVSFTFYCNVCLQCAKWNREYFVTTWSNTAGRGFALADRVLCNRTKYQSRFSFFLFSVSNGSNSSWMCCVVFSLSVTLNPSSVGWGEYLLVELLKVGDGFKKQKQNHLRIFLWEENRAKQHFDAPSVEHADSTVSHINVSLCWHGVCSSCWWDAMKHGSWYEFYEQIHVAKLIIIALIE